MRDPDAPRRIRVEVVYADPREQIVRQVEVASNATVDEAIRASGLLAAVPAGFTPSAVGIFGRVVLATTALHDGDRIELYRALTIDPKEARRRRAEKRT